MKTFFVFLLGLFLAVGVVSAEEKPSDFDTVRKADRFCMGGVGVAGTVTPQELALRRIVKADHAGDDCRKLIKTGTVPGQLYGLLGLKWLKDPGYAEAAAPYLKSKQMVPCIAGCMIMDQMIAGVAHNIDSGAYR